MTYVNYYLSEFQKAVLLLNIDIEAAKIVSKCTKIIKKPANSRRKRNAELHKNVLTNDRPNKIKGNKEAAFENTTGSQKEDLIEYNKENNVDVREKDSLDLIAGYARNIARDTQNNRPITQGKVVKPIYNIKRKNAVIKSRNLNNLKQSITKENNDTAKFYKAKDINERQEYISAKQQQNIQERINDGYTEQGERKIKSTLHNNHIHIKNAKEDHEKNLNIHKNNNDNCLHSFENKFDDVTKKYKNKESCKNEDHNNKHIVKKIFLQNLTSKIKHNEKRSIITKINQIDTNKVSSNLYQDDKKTFDFNDNRINTIKLCNNINEVDKKFLFNTESIENTSLHEESNSSFFINIKNNDKNKYKRNSAKIADNAFVKSVEIDKQLKVVDSTKTNIRNNKKKRKMINMPVNKKNKKIKNNEIENKIKVEVKKINDTKNINNEMQNKDDKIKSNFDINKKCFEKKEYKEIEINSKNAYAIEIECDIIKEHKKNKTIGNEIYNKYINEDNFKNNNLSSKYVIENEIKNEKFRIECKIGDRNEHKIDFKNDYKNNNKIDFKNNDKNDFIAQKNKSIQFDDSKATIYHDLTQNINQDFNQITPQKLISTDNVIKKITPENIFYSDKDSIDDELKRIKAENQKLKEILERAKINVREKIEIREMKDQNNFEVKPKFAHPSNKQKEERSIEDIKKDIENILPNNNTENRKKISILVPKKEEFINKKELLKKVITDKIIRTPLKKTLTENNPNNYVSLIKLPFIDSNDKVEAGFIAPIWTKDVNLNKTVKAQKNDEIENFFKNKEELDIVKMFPDQIDATNDSPNKWPVQK